MYRNYPGWYSRDDGGLWASEWGSGRQPHFQGYSATASSVTFTCDFASIEGTDAAHRYTQALTYTGVTRPTGTGYTLQGTTTAADGGQSSGVDVQQTGLGGIGGDSANLMAWSFQGNGYGMKGFPYLDGVGATMEDDGFWGIITHPRGWIVIEQPNMNDFNAMSAVSYESQGAHGFTVSKTNAGTYAGNTHTTDPIAYLANRSTGRPAPQQYIDARYAIQAGWNQFYGLGPQHMLLPRELGILGQKPFAEIGQMGTWKDGLYKHLDWGERQAVLTAAIGQYITTDGTPQGITGMTELESELYYPATPELEGLVAAPNGRTYTLGTLAELKAGLDLMRILGLVASYWSQWQYPAGPQGDRLSHFNLSSHRSVFFDRYPEFTAGCPNNCYTNYGAPGFIDWMKGWSTQYWLSQGVQGKFMDTAFIVPEVVDWTAPLFRDFDVWYMRQNGFVYAEMPQPWYGPLWYNVGGPYAILGREWGAPFSAPSARFRYCLGAPWANGGYEQAYCDQATAGYFNVGTQYDPAVARRLHSIGAAYGLANQGEREDEYNYEANGHPGHVAAAKAEAFWYGQMQDRYGMPDRVELVNPAPLTNHPYPVHLAADLGTGTAGTPVFAPDEVWVHPEYQLPWAGVIQIDAEQILYRKQRGDAGLWAGTGVLLDVTRGVNGTAPAPHTHGATVTVVGGNPLHWTYEDTDWVYGPPGKETRVRYSDGVVVQGSLPVISNVQVSNNTVIWQTDRPTSGWVEYDTYGSAESQNAQRPAGWWPNYLLKTNLDDREPSPPATAHQRTLTGLTPGATYHYRIVERGPAQAVTADSTFVAS